MSFCGKQHGPSPIETSFARFGPNKCGKVLEAEVDQIYTLCLAPWDPWEPWEPWDPWGLDGTEILADQMGKCTIKRCS